MHAAEIDVGRKIAGKYELVKLLGKGAMGEVWLATHESLGGEFAVKLVRPSDEPEDETAAGRFQLEAQVSAKLSRKTRHIVSVSDHGEEDGLAYLVMELLDGESLESRIKSAGEIPLPLTVAIVSQIARALAAAHAEGIFHRDLKPANIFLSKDEDGRLLVKLLDFGIARTKKPFNTRSPFMTGKDMVLGTPSYMSPEQARGLDSLDYRCDLWALAVVAYESLTRHIPWEGETVEDIFLSICTHRMVSITAFRRDLPPEVEAIFARSFAPKLDNRFASAMELSQAFEDLVDPAELDAAIGARPAATSSRRLVASAANAPTSEPRLVSAGHGAAGPASHGGMPSGPHSGPNSGSAGSYAGGYGPPPAPVTARMGSQPDLLSDPQGFAVGGQTIKTKKQKSSAWVAVALLLLFVTIGGAGFFVYRAKAAATHAPPAPEATVVATSTGTGTEDRTSIPPPPPATNTAANDKPTAATATPVKGTKPVALPAGKNPPAPPPATTSPAAATAPTPPPPATTPATPPAPPPVTAGPTPPTPPPTPKTTDKSQVF